MSRMNYAQLKFPPFEWIKKLPLKHMEPYRDRITKEPKSREEISEYSWTLFTTPTSVHGRFTYNEDDNRMIIFDVMEGGYCDQNRHGLALKFNKTNYQKICKHAQTVYEEFQRELFADQSWRWSKTPEEYAQDNYEEIIY